VPCYSRCDSVASASPGDLLQIQDIGLSSSTELKLAFLQYFQAIQMHPKTMQGQHSRQDSSSSQSWFCHLLLCVLEETPESQLLLQNLSYNKSLPRGCNED
jgi:hypothetical protein